jgi:uncharacterized protein YndB with AHSA1/START domain
VCTGVVRGDDSLSSPGTTHPLREIVRCGDLKIAAQADVQTALRRESVAMAHWTATTTAKATPEQILEVLTHPEEIRRWSPVDFDVDELDARRLAPGTRARVTGKVAGVRVGFDVQVHAADHERLELSADGPVGLDVRYELAPAKSGSELYASVSLRSGGGITGRLVANATAALLTAGALDGAAGRIARAAEVAV